MTWTPNTARRAHHCCKIDTLIWSAHDPLSVTLKTSLPNCSKWFFCHAFSLHLLQRAVLQLCMHKIHLEHEILLALPYSNLARYHDLSIKSYSQALQMILECKGTDYTTCETLLLSPRQLCQALDQILSRNATHPSVFPLHVADSSLESTSNGEVPVSQHYCLWCVTPNPREGTQWVYMPCNTLLLG